MLTNGLCQVDQVVIVDGEDFFLVDRWQCQARHDIHSWIKLFHEGNMHGLLKFLQAARTGKFKGQIDPTIDQQALVGAPEADMSVDWADELEVFIQLDIFFVYIILKRGPYRGLHELRQIIKHTLFLSIWRVIELW